MEKIKLPNDFQPTDWETSVQIEELNRYIEKYNQLRDSYQVRIEMDKCDPKSVMFHYCQTTMLAFNMMEIITYLTGIEIMSNVLILKTLPTFKEIEKIYGFAMGDYVKLKKNMPIIFDINRIQGETKGE